MKTNYQPQPWPMPLHIHAGTVRDDTGEPIRTDGPSGAAIVQQVNSRAVLVDALRSIITENAEDRAANMAPSHSHRTENKARAALRAAGEDI